MGSFFDARSLVVSSWQSLERAVCRLLISEGYSNVRLVGGTGDRGADVLATRFGKRFVYQVKHWKKAVNAEVIDETLSALRFYNAQIPVIVAKSGYESSLYDRQKELIANGVPLQLLDLSDLQRRADKLPELTTRRGPREYQVPVIEAVVRAWLDGAKRALVVMATGLGKTFTAAESIRLMSLDRPLKVLVLAHTNELVYQLEKAFWPFLQSHQVTAVWNGNEQPTQQLMETAEIVFACHKSVAESIRKGSSLPTFDLILVDECHHVGGSMYREIIAHSGAGSEGGPFLLGLTATPWRPDEVDIQDYFGPPLASVDIVTGLRNGYLSNVDYRMHTDNIDWDGLRRLQGDRFSPKYINRTLFISEWNDAVINELRRVWSEVPNPRAIVFCGTIDHAITMRDKINAIGFCRAEALYSSSQGYPSIGSADRSRLLCDFQDGVTQILCSVDILNEGVDVPDVNILVFQRVTHSRRIFVQQLGRGLRLSEHKTKVVVLDFVSDIRRFAAGLELQGKLQNARNGSPVSVRINSKVSFRRVGRDDPEAESFLRQWLEDVAAIEGAEEDASILKFPPHELVGDRK
jgi:superfamily II DNA or RNA helicase